MHEVGIAAAIVDAVLRRSEGARVHRVIVEVGRLSLVQPDALRFAFEICCEGGPLEGTALEIVETAGRARCRACGATFLLERPLGVCACGSIDLDWISGEELNVKAIEVS